MLGLSGRWCDGLAGRAKFADCIQLQHFYVLCMSENLAKDNGYILGLYCVDKLSINPHRPNHPDLAVKQKAL